MDNELTGRKKCVDYVKKVAQVVTDNNYGKGEVLNLLPTFIKNRRISSYLSLISSPEKEWTLSSETSVQSYIV